MDNDRLIRLPAVVAMTGLSRSKIYRRVAAGSFPPQTRLGPRTSAWCFHEVSAWINERIAERDAPRSSWSRRRV
ncbi:helix-turn-helix transcriptional regulator [Novilysobacter spongiicola]|uniref:helix-turn-helix transcriptional regulator n=1 Tax=Novilysobacter spongiicola TaxID=435289 RepID=UPI00099A9D53|nr:AlpA family phage regulatory protein [Lysobacter spongiicola]